MVLRTKPITAAEFDQFVNRPEHIGRDFELIAGEIVEKMVSNPRSSAIGAFIAGALSLHVRQHHSGRVTGADGGYVIGTERYIPDAAFVSQERQPSLPDAAYNPVPPDLAVEVLSPSNDDEEIRLKIANYLAVGTVTWVIDPDRERIEIYTSGQPPRILGAEDTLDGGDILPGFKLAVKDIFAD